MNLAKRYYVLQYADGTFLSKQGAPVNGFLCNADLFDVVNDTEIRVIFDIPLSDCGLTAIVVGVGYRPSAEQVRDVLAGEYDPLHYVKVAECLRQYVEDDSIEDLNEARINRKIESLALLGYL